MSRRPTQSPGITALPWSCLPQSPCRVRILYLNVRPPPRPTLFPYTTLFRSHPFTQNRGSNLSQDCPPQERVRSEEHTSELQSRRELVCRLLLEKKTGFPVRFRPLEGRPDAALNPGRGIDLLRHAVVPGNTAA